MSSHFHISNRPRGFSLLFLVFAISGCELAGVEGEREEEGEPELHCSTDPSLEYLQPLEVGNYWIYQSVGRSGQINVDSIRHEIVGRFAVPGKPHIEAFLLDVTPSYFDQLEILQNTETGLHTLGFIREGDTTLYNRITYPYPATQGEIFYERLLTFSEELGRYAVTDSFTYDVQSTDHMTVTGIGNVQTIVYHRQQKFHPAFDHPLEEIYGHYLPGVGLARRESHTLSTIDNPLPWAHLRLIDYCLMQPVE